MQSGPLLVNWRDHAIPIHITHDISKLLAIFENNEFIGNELMV